MKARRKIGSFRSNHLVMSEIPKDSIEDVIIRRGSTREFSRESITFAELSTMLDRATRGIDGLSRVQKNRSTSFI